MNVARRMCQIAVLSHRLYNSVSISTPNVLPRLTITPERGIRILFSDFKEVEHRTAGQPYWDGTLFYQSGSHLPYNDTGYIQFEIHSSKRLYVTRDVDDYSTPEHNTCTFGTYRYNNEVFKRVDLAVQKR